MTTRVLFDTANIQQNSIEVDTTSVSLLVSSPFLYYRSGGTISPQDELPLAGYNTTKSFRWGSRLVEWDISSSQYNILAGPLLFPTLPVYVQSAQPTDLPRPIIYMDWEFTLESNRSSNELDIIRIGFFERNTVGGNLQLLPEIVAVDAILHATNSGQFDRFLMFDAQDEDNGALLMLGGNAQGAPSSLLFDMATGRSRGATWVNRLSMAIRPPQLVYYNGGQATFNGELLGYTFNGLSAGAWKNGNRTAAWQNQAPTNYMPTQGPAIRPPSAETKPFTNIMPFLRLNFSDNSGSALLYVQRLRVWEVLPATESADSDAPQAVTIQGYGEGLDAQEVKVINTEAEPVPIDDVSVAPGATLPPDA